MNIALWIAQGVAGIMFTMAGFMKTVQPKEKLAPKMPWVNSFSGIQVKLIGLAELLGGIGLIVPWLTGIEPILTPVAAAGLAFIMLSAMVYHFTHKEYPAIGFNVILFAVTFFVAYGRC